MSLLPPLTRNRMQELRTSSRDSRETETRKSPVKCRPGWTPYGEKCYRVTEDSYGWDESLAQCLSAHSTLASVHDGPTNDFLYNLAPSSFWLGGVRTGPGKDDWAWADQSPFDYKNWVKGQPDNWLAGWFGKGDENRIEMRKGTSPSRAWLRLNAFLVLACLPAFLPACSLARAPLLELPHLTLELPCLSSFA